MKTQTATTNRQQERKEKKKKKLAALANLVQINDKDRIEEAIRARSDSVSPQPAEVKTTTTTNGNPEPAEDDGFVTVTYRKTSRNKTTAMTSTRNTGNDDEPQVKRAKLSTSVSGAPTQNEDSNDSVSSLASSQDEHLQKMKLSLTQEQYVELRRQLRERKRQLENVPSLRLRLNGHRASLQTPQDQRTPIFLTDIQHLMMAALIGKKSPCMPDRWCLLEKPLRLSHSVVLILEGLSLYDYLSHESSFEQTNKIFETRLEMVLPPCKENKIIEQLAQVPLTNVQAQQLIEQYGSLESAVEMIKDPTLLVKAIFSIDASSQQAPENVNLPPGDKIPRTKLLLSALQMVDEGYPMPLRGELSERFKSYVFTKSQYAPVTDHSPLFGIDCEMCRTSVGLNELTRISIVDEDLKTIYETLVLPSNRIVDYLTPYSGITAEIMKTVTKTLQEVQREVRELLPPDAILVGQSLNSDLNAMQMMHPYVIDTSVCFNLSGVRKRKAKLQTLALTFLKETIQTDVDGHDSIEDSQASLKLVKMKLANSVDFGDEILLQKKRVLDIIRMASGDNIKQNLLAHASQRDKRTAIVTAGELQSRIKNILKQAEDAGTKDKDKDVAANKAVSLYELDSNKDAVRKAREIALENALTIANLQLEPEQFASDAATKTMAKLDKWIGKLWKSIAHNGMFLVLMGGSSECPSGVAKIAIKRNTADVAVEVPIKI